MFPVSCFLFPVPAGVLPVQRSRSSRRPPPHERLRLAHLQAAQRRRQGRLLQVPLQGRCPLLPLTPDPCLWCSVTSRHLTPPAALVPSDGPGHQEPGGGGGRPAGRHQPRLRHRRLVQRHRQRQLPVLDLLHPGHDLRAGRDLPVQPLRPHQGTAA